MLRIVSPRGWTKNWSFGCTIFLQVKCRYLCMLRNIFRTFAAQKCSQTDRDSSSTILYSCAFCKICMSHLHTILVSIMTDSFLHKSANDDYFYHQLFVRAAYTSQHHIVLLYFAQNPKIKKRNTHQQAKTSASKICGQKYSQDKNCHAAYWSHFLSCDNSPMRHRAAYKFFA